MTLISSKNFQKKQLQVSEKELDETYINRPENRKILMRLFWSLLATILGLACITAKTSNLEDIALFLTLLFTTLVPSYLWCKGKVYGLPILPVFSFSYILTYAMPLIGHEEILNTYTSAERLFAGSTTIGFLWIITATWYKFAKRVRTKPSAVFMIDGSRADDIFLFFLFISTIFSMSLAGDWFSINATQFFSLIRGIVFGLTTISAFALGFRHGERKLSSSKTLFLQFLVVTYCVSNATSLLLVMPMTFLVIIGIGFVMGRKKIPFISLLLAILIIVPLHYGKGEMRAKYFATGINVQPWEYPAYYTEWFGKNFENKPFTYFSRREDELSDLVGVYGVEAPDNKQRLSDRASLLQQLLLTQIRSPDIQPFLEGVTYLWIPQLLIPRLFLDSKISAHYATSILNIYYGRQRLQDTFSTTIGWGLLSEAYANFGLIGCVVLAIILGYVFGNISAWSHYAPLLSARYLISVLILIYAFNDSVASVFVSSLFQSLISLLILNFFVMEKRQIINHKN
ncbi:MAG: hypothetical protein WCO45_11690 [Pseudanabaena sp. ELA607]